MPVSSIKKVMFDRGYGFINPEGGGADVFFHFSVLKDTDHEDLKEGDLVEYELEIGDKGPRATVVKKQ